jgi:hypothetical protein
MVWVTLDVAEHFLLHVTRPRTLSKKDVDRYTRIMARGRWASRSSEDPTFSWRNATSIDTDECAELGYDCATRELLQGRQRMEAMVKAAREHGLPGVWMEFAYDVDPAIMRWLDTGRSRSDRDHSMVAGDDWPPVARQIARRIVSWQTPGRAGAPHRGFTPDVGETDDVLIKYEDSLKAAIAWAAEATRNLGLPGGMLGFAHWLINDQLDPSLTEVAAVFLADVGGRGANLADDSIALLYRNRISAEFKANPRFPDYRGLALLCSAWNAHVRLIKHTLSRVRAAEEGRTPPKAKKPQGYLRIPEGDGVSAKNFPFPMRK